MGDANNCFIEIPTCGIIVVPLDPDDCSITTAVPSIVTTGWTSMTLTNEVEEGTDYSAKGINGAQCGPRLQGDTVVKWVNVAGVLCAKNLALFSMLDGNPTVVDADDNIIGRQRLLGGVSASSSVCASVANKPKVAMLFARKATDSDGGCGVAGSTTGMTGLMGHFFNMMTDFLFEEETFEDARAAYNFTAKLYANPNIGRGPWNLWPATAIPTSPHDASGHSEVFINPGSFPTPSCNPINHPTVVAPA